MPRELTVTVDHPQTLADGDMVKVGTALYPYLTLLYDGDAPNGWAGDTRLCFYLGPEGRYYLYRLEHDGVYRMVCRSAPFGVGMMGQEGVQKLIRELISKDSHRGVDVGAETIAHNVKLDSDRDKAFNELIDEEVAPRLGYAFGRMYLPGLDILPRLR